MRSPIACVILWLSFIVGSSATTCFAQAEVATAELPALPIKITSFGAARLGESIFVYGGHLAGAHDYWKDSQSNQLLQLDLSGKSSGWKEIATAERIQGLGMVAHDQRLIVIGGFIAMNDKGQKQDLHSQATVQAWNVAEKRWQDLPSLPEPRSSHDAAIVGDTIYVVGGWNMQGEGNTTWHKTAWSMDLSANEPKWTALPEPPFVRRALALVAHQGKLFAIGGMEEGGSPTRAAAIYDPTERQWQAIADIHGTESMAGFGAAAWSLNDQLIVTTYEGSIQRWNEQQKGWDELGQTKDARFFHRLLPLDSKHLVSIGGANMEVGKFTELETVDLN